MVFTFIRRARSLVTIAALVGAFVSALVAAPAGAQQLPVRDLPKPAREIDDPFSYILAAREARAGQLLVSDGAEVQITLVDFAKGTKTPIGRQGGGPGEYQMAMGLFVIRGDTLWVLDQAQRMVVFFLDGKSGTTFPMMFANAQDSTTLSAPMATDARGFFYANALPIKVATSGSRTAVDVADSSALVRFDPRVLNAPRTTLTKVRTAAAGNPVVQTNGTNIKVTAPFPGLVPADAWAVFPDGRVAVVRGANYRIEFIGPDGRHAPPVTIAYERTKFTEADKKAEMDGMKRQIAEQSGMMKKMLPPGYTMEFDITPPPAWPSEYPPLSLLGALAAPDGRLWVKRAVPERIAREQWDVIDQAGKVVARWQLPPKTSIVALGNGTVYTVRVDDDDLRYVQRVELPGCTECGGR